MDHRLKISDQRSYSATKRKGKTKVEVDAVGMRLVRAWEEAKRKGRPPRSRGILKGVNENQLPALHEKISRALRENFFPVRTWFGDLTARERLNYSKKLEESGGFDVGDVPHDIIDLPVKPIPLHYSKTLMELKNHSSFAIDEHNKELNTKYHFGKVLKAKFSPGTGYGPLGPLYYITFQVKDIARTGSPTLNFPAKVCAASGVAPVVMYSELEP